MMVAELPIQTLLRLRTEALGLRPIELVRRTKLKNHTKALRRLDALARGDTDSTRGLIAELPLALGVSKDEVDAVISNTRIAVAEAVRLDENRFDAEFSNNIDSDYEDFVNESLDYFRAIKITIEVRKKRE